MKRIFLLTIFLLTGTLIFSQQESGNQMPVTTNSKSALSYYVKAIKYFNDVNLKEALETFKKALNQDKDFFLVNYQLALYFILNRDGDNFNKFADDAINWSWYRCSSAVIAQIENVPGHVYPRRTCCIA